MKLIHAALILASIPASAKIIDDPEFAPKPKPENKPAPKPNPTPATNQKNQNVSSVEEAIQKYFHAVPIIPTDKNSHAIKVTINKKPHHMILDSAEGPITINQQIADNLKIPLTKTAEADIFSGKIEQLRIGGRFELRNTDTLFTYLKDLPSINANGAQKVKGGKIGLKFLNSLPCAIDYPTNRLLVQKSPVKGGLASIQKQLGDSSVKMLEDEQRRHYITLTINGKNAYFLVDTAATTNIIHQRAAKPLGITSEGNQNQPGQTFTATVPGLRIGTLQLKGEFKFDIIKHNGKLHTVNNIPVVGSVGAALFRPLKATVDFASDTITLAVTRKK